MNKQLPIYLYGSILILVGVFLLFSEKMPFPYVQITLGISLIVGAIFGFITAFNRRRHQVQFDYHEMHAMTMLVYGVSLLLLGNSTEKIIAITAFLFLFYAVSEIIFCNWLYNLAQHVVFKIVAIRALLGIITGIGAVVALDSMAIAFQVFGVLFILVGINIIFYVPVMRSNLKT